MGGNGCGCSGCEVAIGVVVVGVAMGVDVVGMSRGSSGGGCTHVRVRATHVGYAAC